MNEDEELACTCGGKAELKIYIDEEDGDRVNYYQCSKCGFCGPEHIGSWAEEGAADDWKSAMKHARYAVREIVSKRE